MAEAPYFYLSLHKKFGTQLGISCSCMCHLLYYQENSLQIAHPFQNEVWVVCVFRQKCSYKSRFWFFTKVVFLNMYAKILKVGIMRFYIIISLLLYLITVYILQHCFNSILKWLSDNFSEASLLKCYRRSEWFSPQSALNKNLSFTLFI